MAYYLKKEYDSITSKERIGKGIVYIAKFVAKELFNYLKNEKNVDNEYYIHFIQEVFNFGEENALIMMQHFALLLLSEFVLSYPQSFEKIIRLIEEYANHNDWSVRESAAYSIKSGLKKIPDNTMEFLSKWAKNGNECLRRIVSESLRPSRDVIWLRNPKKNDKVLNILTDLRKDPSIYVRKSVGNNIKDLSKYMPEKMLNLMERWIEIQKNETNIMIYDELAMENGLNKEEKRLIWTMKHGMRWLRVKNPEFHPRLEKILGKNYVLYFDEKRNRLARPP